jgi:hypothetical protein
MSFSRLPIVVGSLSLLLMCLPSVARAQGALSPALSDASSTEVNATYIKATGPRGGTGGGINAVMSLSLVEAFGSRSGTASGFRLRDWWTLDLGVGDLNQDVGVYLNFRLGLALRPAIAVNEHLDLFSRLGYFTGTRLAPSGNGRGGYDAIYATLGTRFERLFVEGGIGSNGTTGNKYKLFLGNVGVRVSDTGMFRYLGVRVEEFANIDGGHNELDLMLTAGSH